VGRAQDYELDGTLNSGSTWPGFQWAVVSWQLEGVRVAGREGAMGEPAADCAYFTMTPSDGIVSTWSMFQRLSIADVNLCRTGPEMTTAIRRVFRPENSIWRLEDIEEQGTVVFWCNIFSVQVFFCEFAFFLSLEPFCTLTSRRKFPSTLYTQSSWRRIQIIQVCN
jgi:hypothetical protein